MNWMHGAMFGATLLFAMGTVFMGNEKMKDDLISRQAAIDVVHKSIFDFFDICDDDEESPMTYKDERLLELNKAITAQIKAAPSAERHGHWIYTPTNILGYVCSECGKAMCRFNYCPNCGALMDEVAQ